MSVNRERRALLFDMDGVLVDVSGSFREIICQLVCELAGEKTSAREIQALKNHGGFNDDIRLSLELVLRHGGQATFEKVKERFDAIYQGTDGAPGLWTRERWLVPPRLLARLAKRHALGVVTGRTGLEVACARRLEPTAFDHLEVVVTQDEVTADRLKPRPDTLIMALERLGAKGGLYVGDTVDDQQAARAAGLEAIGVIPPGAIDPDGLRERLLACGAATVLDSILQIEGWA